MAAAKRTRATKPTGRLAELAATKKNPTVLLGDIQGHVLKRVDDYRRTDIIHPSEMAKADWCPRQTYYRLSETEKSDPPKLKSAQLEMIFDEGHEIHRKWQGWVSDIGKLGGRWYCERCEEPRTGTFTSGQCPVCNWTMQYREVPLHSARHRIAGHADGAIESENAILEVKSIGLGTLRFEDAAILARNQVATTEGKKIYDLEAIWKSIRYPLPSHARQTNIYLALAQEMGLPYDRTIYLYEYKPTQATKEFVVKYNPDIAEPLMGQALDVVYALEKERVPPRPSHTSPIAKVCRECPWQTLCWGEDRSIDDEAEQDEEGTTGGHAAPTAGKQRGRTHTGRARLAYASTPAERGSDDARGSDGTGRQVPDVDAVEDDGLVGVRERATSGSRGGRAKPRRLARSG